MTVRVGDRVPLISMVDEWTRLGPGTEGTVRFVDALGTIHVDWDSGSHLGLVAEAGDEWLLLE